jgi:hypothetical protein
VLPAIRGAIPANDPRTVATIEAVRSELAQQGFVYRFRPDDRALGDDEGAFLLCGFLMALADHQQGNDLAAVRWFERSRTACGPPGLFAEEFDVEQRQLRGNLPQAFVHVLAVRNRTSPRRSWTGRSRVMKPRPARDRIAVAKHRVPGLREPPMERPEGVAMSEDTQSGAKDVADVARHEAAVYRGDNPRPLGGYLAVLGIYCTVVAVASVLAALTGRTLPTRWRVQDLVTVTLGTHKLSRTLSKDAVTSPLRAPFTQYADTGGPAEVDEEVRKDSQLRHSVGELLTCPFCLDMWVVTAFAIGLILVPRFTRLIAGSFTALAGADFLQLAYARAQQSAED